jgi:septal ring factor EnvC (AmiA/AmiB activator)
MTYLWDPQQVGGLAAVLLFTVLATGCVSQTSYELARKDADMATLRYQQEQERTQGLTATNKKMRQYVDELETSLRDTKERLARADKDWKDTRDELLKLKITQEQGQKRSKGRDIMTPPPGPETSGRSVEPDTTKRQIKELLEQLQQLVQ